MKNKILHTLFLSVAFLLPTVVQAQEISDDGTAAAPPWHLPFPDFWFGCAAESTDFAGVDSAGNAVAMVWNGDFAALSADFINGYPALQIDSGGWFSFLTDKLLGKNNALFLIVYEPQDADYEREIALWSLENGSRKKFLSSVSVGDFSSNVRYKYFFDKGPNVTTNLVNFQRDTQTDTVDFADNDTIFVGKVDSLLFSGKLAEFMIIAKPMTEVERQIWQSFLAVKYGVTMYKGDYLNSLGDTLWHYIDNQDFASGVGGIGRDNTLGLVQNFSRIYGDSVTIFLHGTNNFSPIQAAQTTFQNGEYFFWGHTENPAEIGYNVYGLASAFYNFFQRTWKVKPHLQNTYTLDIQLNTAENADAQNLKLFVCGTKNFNYFETNIYSPQIVENQKVTFSNILIPQTADSSFYFTFGKNTDLDEQTDGGANVGANGGYASQNPAYEVFTQATWLPNPVIDNLHINYTLTRNANIWFSVHTNGGIPVCQTSPQNKQAGENQAIIPMSHLITGTYTVYVHVDDMLIMQVVIKS